MVDAIDATDAMDFFFSCCVRVWVPAVICLRLGTGSLNQYRWLLASIFCAGTPSLHTRYVTIIVSLRVLLTPVGLHSRFSELLEI